MLEEERHWDYVCLTILTIATAALAGVFIILGIAYRETGRTQRTQRTQRTVWSGQRDDGGAGSSAVLIKTGTDQPQGSTRRDRWLTKPTKQPLG